MHILILILTVCCMVAACCLLVPTPNGNSWSRWNAKKKTNFVTRFISSLKRKGTAIKNSPSFYMDELDSFYIKDQGNLDYKVSNVLENLIRIHESQ